MLAYKHTYIHTYMRTCIPAYHTYIHIHRYACDCVRWDTVGLLVQALAQLNASDCMMRATARPEAFQAWGSYKVMQTSYDFKSHRVIE